MPVITKPNQHFDVTTYTGNGTSVSITNSGSMQPDLVWIKSRSVSSRNTIFDAVRGTNKVLWSDSTDAEGTANAGTGLTAFASNGFTLGTEIAGTSGSTNTNGTTYVGWQWKAGGTAVTNTSGSISSQVSANQTAGFSIVTYTGNGTSGATVGHGLGVAPSFIIIKVRSTTNDWPCYHTSVGNTKAMYLNLGQAAAGPNAAYWNNTTPSSSVFTLGTSSDLNANTATFVAYCFAQVAGYSAFGSYTGNGSTDGPFVFTGFRPRFVMIKRAVSAGTGSWAIYDTSRSPYNVASIELAANESSAEYNRVEAYMDILSNGIKLRNSDNWHNINGDTYIYACFAEAPFKFSNAR